MNSQLSVVKPHRGEAYQRVFDGRKKRIRGLWKRNDRYYAQLSVRDPDTGRLAVRRVALLDEKTQQPVATAAAAKEALDRLKIKRADDSLPVLKRCPRLQDYVKAYEDHLAAMPDKKRPATVAKEKSILARWVKHLGGDLRLNQIAKVHIRGFQELRQQKGASARTVNIDLIVLRGLLKMALQEGLIQRLPMDGLRPLRHVAKKRMLVTFAEIQSVWLAAAQPAYQQGELLPKGEVGQPLKNAVQFTDYLKLLAFSGARRNEGLALQWQRDVSFERRQLTIGADGLAKNHKARVVDFNPELEALLKDMATRRAPDSLWLFPSPQRGEEDRPAKTFKETLNLARTYAAREHPHLARFGFHDCRHFFISMCVMGGIDFMTIAEWVGHADGGVLIGKVYGHLAAEHRRKMADKLVLGVSTAASPAKLAVPDLTEA